MFLNKRINQRFFEVDKSNNILNPAPGTVIDQHLVENAGDDIFDFYIIP
jgi:aubergine-like protein